RIETVLISRLQQAIRAWTSAFMGVTEDAIIPEASASKSRRKSFPEKKERKGRVVI
ncbi:hypothetical protein INT48_006680, partial [Thamnidium elegans]